MGELWETFIELIHELYFPQIWLAGELLKSIDIYL